MWRDIATATVGGAVFGAGINIGIGGGSKILGNKKSNYRIRYLEKQYI